MKSDIKTTTSKFGLLVGIVGKEDGYKWLGERLGGNIVGLVLKFTIGLLIVVALIITGRAELLNRGMATYYR